MSTRRDTAVCAVWTEGNENLWDAGRIVPTEDWAGGNSAGSPGNAVSAASGA